MCSIYWLHKQINNTQIDNAKDINVETFRNLWQYYGYEPVLNDAGTISNFQGNSSSFGFTPKIRD